MYLFFIDFQFKYVGLYRIAYLCKLDFVFKCTVQGFKIGDHVACVFKIDNWYESLNTTMLHLFYITNNTCCEENDVLAINHRLFTEHISPASLSGFCNFQVYDYFCWTATCFIFTITIVTTTTSILRNKHWSN